jgi:aminoglycoside phosphotransferase (APT) family kinase protein
MASAASSVDSDLVRRLVASQFPQWADLPVKPVARSGWDNRTFHLGDDMSVRLPSAEAYSAQVAVEQRWLPFLAPSLPLRIPEPLAMGSPSHGYPWNWSVYRWIPGVASSQESINNLPDFVRELAAFLASLQQINAASGPQPGPTNFYRGGSLSVYDDQARSAIGALGGRINTSAADRVWSAAMSTCWDRPPVWVHGDIAIGNLLLNRGSLAAVIDFGQLAVGDPACDLAIAWTLLRGDNREAFRKALGLDSSTWQRGRAWALWKAMIVAAGITTANADEGVLCWQVIDEVLAEHAQTEA